MSQMKAWLIRPFSYTAEQPTPFIILALDRKAAKFNGEQVLIYRGDKMWSKAQAEELTPELAEQHLGDDANAYTIQTQPQGVA